MASNPKMTSYEFEDMTAYMNSTCTMLFVSQLLTILWFIFNTYKKHHEGLKAKADPLYDMIGGCIILIISFAAHIMCWICAFQ